MLLCHSCDVFSFSNFQQLLCTSSFNYVWYIWLSPALQVLSHFEKMGLKKGAFVFTCFEDKVLPVGWLQLTVIVFEDTICPLAFHHYIFFLSLHSFHFYFKAGKCVTVFPIYYISLWMWRKRFLKTWQKPPTTHSTWAPSPSFSCFCYSGFLAFLEGILLPSPINAGKVELRLSKM